MKISKRTLIYNNRCSFKKVPLLVIGISICDMEKCNTTPSIVNDKRNSRLKQTTKVEYRYNVFDND